VIHGEGERIQVYERGRYVLDASQQIRIAFSYERLLHQDTQVIEMMAGPHSGEEFDLTILLA
jgi:hypothetical protein